MNNAIESIFRRVIVTCARRWPGRRTSRRRTYTPDRACPSTRSATGWARRARLARLARSSWGAWNSSNTRVNRVTFTPRPFNRNFVFCLYLKNLKTVLNKNVLCIEFVGGVYGSAGPTFQALFHYYADAICSKATLSVLASGHYSPGSDSERVQGATEFDFYVQSVIITVHDESTARNLNGLKVCKVVFSTPLQLCHDV